MSDEGRAEAERRDFEWEVFVADDGINSIRPSGMTHQDAFVAGAEWQASRTPAVAGVAADQVEQWCLDNRGAYDQDMRPALFDALAEWGVPVIGGPHPIPAPAVADGGPWAMCGCGDPAAHAALRHTPQSPVAR